MFFGDRCALDSMNLEESSLEELEAGMYITALFLPPPLLFLHPPRVCSVLNLIAPSGTEFFFREIPTLVS